MGVCVAISVPLECSGCRVATTGGKPPPAPVGRRMPRSTIRNFNPRLAYVHPEYCTPLSEGLGERAGTPDCHCTAVFDYAIRVR